LKHVS